MLGGIGSIDTYESVFSTWAIAHGQLACAFPTGYRVIAPVYPFLSGGIAAVGHIGNTVPFPSRPTMGAHCDMAFTVINNWSLKSDALDSTMKIAYVSWFFLMAGLVSLLRTTGRGRCGWEPTTLVLVACLPPVWMSIESTFHPQDLIAMGFALGAMSCARRGTWMIGGVLVALAVLTQQFALLVAAPLLVLAPGRQRLAFAGGAVGTTILVALPLLVANPGGAIHAIVFGTGNTGGIGGTVLWELNLHGAPLVLLSRILPIGLSLVIAWWTVRRLGSVALKPAALIALMAVCLSLRLPFEQQIFGYYFMALSVALVLLDVVRGHIRGSLVAWLVTVSMVYLLGSDALSLLRPPWSTIVQDLIPLAVIILAALLIVLTIRRGDVGWMLGLWVGMIAAALLTWNQTNVLGIPPTWFWQVILVPLGIALAAGPLVQEIQEADPQRGRGQAVPSLAG